MIPELSPELQTLAAFSLGVIAFVIVLAIADTIADRRKRKLKPSLPKRLVIENARRDRDKKENRIAINRILQ